MEAGVGVLGLFFLIDTFVHRKAHSASEHHQSVLLLKPSDSMSPLMVDSECFPAVSRRRL